MHSTSSLLIFFRSTDDHVFDVDDWSDGGGGPRLRGSSLDRSGLRHKSLADRPSPLFPQRGSSLCVNHVVHGKGSADIFLADSAVPIKSLSYSCPNFCSCQPNEETEENSIHQKLASDIDEKRSCQSLRKPWLQNGPFKSEEKETVL